jgi:hypothetical protein
MLRDITTVMPAALEWLGVEGLSRLPVPLRTAICDSHSGAAAGAATASSPAMGGGGGGGYELRGVGGGLQLPGGGVKYLLDWDKFVPVQLWRRLQGTLTHSQITAACTAAFGAADGLALVQTPPGPGR